MTQDITSQESLSWQAVLAWGHSAQIDMIVEECSELILALQHFKRGRNTADEVANEIADVSIMLDQARIIFGSDAIHFARQKKNERLAARLADYKARAQSEAR